MRKGRRDGVKPLPERDVAQGQTGKVAADLRRGHSVIEYTPEERYDDEMRWRGLYRRKPFTPWGIY